MAEQRATGGTLGQLTPDSCRARWTYRGVSSSDQEAGPEHVQGSLLIKTTSSGVWEILIIMPLFLTVFGTGLAVGIYALFSLRDLFAGIFLILITFGPVLIFADVIVGGVVTLFYNSKFTPPCLTLNRTELVPGSAITVQYRHRRRKTRATVHGFVLAEVVAATHTHLPSTSAEGPSTDTHFQVLWSSGVQTHLVAPNTAGMSFEQVITLPEGFPDTGPLPLEGKELKKEAVWYLRVYEVVLPRSSCTYEFILPVGRARPEPPARPPLPHVSTGQDLCVA